MCDFDGFKNEFVYAYHHVQLLCHLPLCFIWGAKADWHFGGYIILYYSEQHLGLKGWGGGA